MAQNQDINLFMEGMGFHRRLGVSFLLFYFHYFAFWLGGKYLDLQLNPASAINQPHKYIYVMNKHVYVLV